LARILMVGGGCRGRELARGLVADGHAVRISTRDPRGARAIEEAGAEPWIGTPDVVGSLRYALENVTVLCWLLGTASGPADQVAALHDARLRMMLSLTIDTTVRGVVYEAAGTVDPRLLEEGARLAAGACGRSRIPFEALDADPRDLPLWLSTARRAIDGLLARSRPAVGALGARPAGPALH
jgi:uncharacterized protein YbjT (DUF2867 family)